MEYRIKFCVGCYLKNAMNLTDALLKGHAHDEGFAIKLMPGEAGQFDVAVDDRTLYSKKGAGRLPTIEDIASGLPVTEGEALESANDDTCGCG